MGTSPTPSPPPPPDTRAPPAWLSLLGMALLLGLLSWMLQRGAPVEAELGPGFVHEQTVLRDVLTGRLTDASGVPLLPTSGWGSEEQPVRLRFVPGGDKQQAGAAIDDMVRFLRARTGYAIEGAILRNYGLVVQEIVQGQCEVAFLTAASYARARYATENNDDPGDDILAVLAAVRDGHPEFPGSDLAYRGAIITHVDSDITDVRQLDATRTVAMGNRTSGAGSILPTALFNQLGLRPEIHRVEGYPVIVTAVLQKSVDAGCVYWSPPTADRPENDGRRTVRQSSPEVFEQTRIIGYTPWIPNEPVVMRAALPGGIRHVLARAISLYVTSEAATPEGRERLESIGGVVGYVPADNDDFQPLMEVIQAAFANDPEGRADFMAGNK
jgi:ABC-type phosphate/phosphonate transport system substrate-binding protein